MNIWQTLTFWNWTWDTWNPHTSPRICGPISPVVFFSENRVTVLFEEVLQELPSNCLQNTRPATWRRIAKDAQLLQLTEVLGCGRKNWMDTLLEINTYIPSYSALVSRWFSGVPCGYGWNVPWRVDNFRRIFGKLLLLLLLLLLLSLFSPTIRTSVPSSDHVLSKMKIGKSIKQNKPQSDVFGLRIRQHFVHTSLETCAIFFGRSHQLVYCPAL